jgi:hypothetical protein
VERIGGGKLKNEKNYQNKIQQRPLMVAVQYLHAITNQKHAGMMVGGLAQLFMPIVFFGGGDLTFCSF